MFDPVSLIGTGLALWSAITSTISAFKDGGGLLSKWREKRAARRIRANQYDELDGALLNAPNDVQREYRRLLGLIGPGFARGDGRRSTRCKIRGGC
jgi:hypothetical protein